MTSATIYHIAMALNHIDVSSQRFRWLPDVAACTNNFVIFHVAKHFLDGDLVPKTIAFHQSCAQTVSHAVFKKMMHLLMVADRGSGNNRSVSNLSQAVLS